MKKLKIVFVVVFVVVILCASQIMAFAADSKYKVAMALPGLITDEAVEMGKLAVLSGLYPLLEYENGKLINQSETPKNYLELQKTYKQKQKRFKHLFK